MKNNRQTSSRSIYEDLKAQILDGTYLSGSPMPSTRALAVELGVARTTVVSAYEQLLCEGLIESHQGAATRVARLHPVARQRSDKKSTHETRLSDYGRRIQHIPPRYTRTPDDLLVDFRYGDLAGSDFPAQVWKRAISVAASQTPEKFAYADPQGSVQLRKALQTYLWRTRGIRCHADQLLIVNGSQQGLDLCARLLLNSSDSFVIEEPCYAMARHLFMSVGAQPGVDPIFRVLEIESSYSEVESGQKNRLYGRIQEAGGPAYGDVGSVGARGRGRVECALV